LNYLSIYLDVLKNNAFVGDRVAVIGAGGIGFDVSEFITHVHKGIYLSIYLIIQLFNNSIYYYLSLSIYLKVKEH
jgi:hypothetical protein